MIIIKLNLYFQNLSIDIYDAIIYHLCNSLGRVENFNATMKAINYFLALYLNSLFYFLILTREFFNMILVRTFCLKCYCQIESTK